MKFTHYRQSTARLNYAGKTFLIDPMLAEKGTYPPFEGAVTGNMEMNPLVDLPLSLNELTSGLDAVIVTHLHYDHWDEVAAKILDKNLPIFVQDELDAAVIRESGFTKVYVLGEDTQFDNITISRVYGEHVENLNQFPEEVQTIIGKVCGFVLRHADEKTIYFTGDSMLDPFVKDAVVTHQPDIIVMNAGGNAMQGVGKVVMDANDVHILSQLTDAQLVAVHMEAVNHWTLSRSELAHFASEKGFADQLIIPKDGEYVEF
ncbi:TPA: MBL fold metallo-hydrolase [Streptococcus suis]|uniref:MBL fold metallo-hydrolase n=1 Tax=Streptococcus TaxID=1301 RepID=UPI001960114E|nr:MULTISPECIES: MBL fold metallo-hydrolase [Streptococcus]MBM7134886.1 MBL fold metallo-hydrolase [Streptococcus suis]MBO3641745.1 MBL fold metallo-hydrolase [Streptococcus suis]MBY0730376.1 MBL fold metallo-hydrolase [Streptococcus sp. 2018162]MCO8176007.1 MBL fold metallo-hydrolase [Streptococcus suis]HEM3462968.1 MBL fold metallo-hydrolase [Streptococcus suis]